MNSDHFSCIGSRMISPIHYFPRTTLFSKQFLHNKETKPTSCQVNHDVMTVFKHKNYRQIWEMMPQITPVQWSEGVHLSSITADLTSFLL